MWAATLASANHALPYVAFNATSIAFGSRSPDTGWTLIESFTTPRLKSTLPASSSGTTFETLRCRSPPM
jgi:hypothetical protein